jgi:hypothetical protein
MTGTYKISAKPSLYPEGEYQGKLRGVTFTAASSTEKREWFSTNRGQFETAFSEIMPHGLAKVIVESLMHGDEVEFPDLYREDQFERGFLFEWSPVHLIVPPLGFPREFSY